MTEFTTPHITIGLILVAFPILVAFIGAMVGLHEWKRQLLAKRWASRR